MTPDRREHFRRKLVEQRATLGSRIGEARERAREPIEEGGHDLGDDAVRDLVADTTLDVGELRTRQLEEVDDALLRLELGEYGVCEACGRRIELDRLEAVPSTRFCKEDARRAFVERPSKL
jgi:DnaK suppressor protein